MFKEIFKLDISIFPIVPEIPAVINIPIMIKTQFQTNLYEFRIIPFRIASNEPNKVNPIMTKKITFAIVVTNEKSIKVINFNDI